MKNKHFGILAAIDWNSNKWKKYPTEEDLLNSNFSYVQQNEHTFTYLNFAHKEYPGMSEGEYEAFIPHFWTNLPAPEESKYVNVVFIKTKNYQIGKTYIVGLYGFPKFAKKQKQINTEERIEKIDVNLISKKEDILLLDNPIDIGDESILRNILPSGRAAGKMKYNYLTCTNVKRILDLMRDANPNMMELKTINGIKARLIKSLPSS